VRWLTKPGLALQSLTTREPDEKMLEVSIAALKGVLAADGMPITEREESEEKLQPSSLGETANV